MLVIKFGGASVKNAKEIENLKNILLRYYENKKLVIVISAMGKITNALEKLVEQYFHNKDFNNHLTDIKNFHISIIKNLFSEKTGFFLKNINIIFNDLENSLKTPPSLCYDFEYDKIVHFGEILSTKIISLYLNYSEIKNQWIDARKIIKTNNTYRNAKIDWDLSTYFCKKTLDFTKNNFFITQGFIGSTSINLTTTLGREGSDYTGAILAYILNAETFTVWKDVDGILNADPKIFQDTKKIDKLSYQEIIELAYFGAKVIHPKTIKPLENKQIPLIVKSFLYPEKEGTVINKNENLKINFPIFIVKNKQILISVSSKDFSFMEENNLSQIFSIFWKMGIKINLMQKTALTFSVCINYPERKFEKLIQNLQKDFKVKYNENLELITIRHYTKNAINEIIKNRKIYIEDRNRLTIRFVMKASFLT